MNHLMNECSFQERKHKFETRYFVFQMITDGFAEDKVIQIAKKITDITDEGNSYKQNKNYYSIDYHGKNHK